MDMTGERRIEAPRQTVWQALNDPAVLKASIPGCESLEKLSDTDMKATTAVKIGPIAARFTGAVHLTDIDPPNGYTIGGEGQGGVAGFAKGGAKVQLEDAGAGTLLHYEVHAQVGGKIAQLGARLIDATAKQMANSFFDRFGAQVGTAGASGRPGRRTDAAAPVAAKQRKSPSSIGVLALLPREPFGLPLVAWIGGAIYLFMLVLISEACCMAGLPTSVAETASCLPIGLRRRSRVGDYRTSGARHAAGRCSWRASLARARPRLPRFWRRAGTSAGPAAMLRRAGPVGGCL